MVDQKDQVLRVMSSILAALEGERSVSGGVLLYALFASAFSFIDVMAESSSEKRVAAQEARLLFNEAFDLFERSIAKQESTGKSPWSV